MTGDHVAIFPTNSTTVIERIGELLEADLDTVFSLTNVDGTHISHVTRTIDQLSDNALRAVGRKDGNMVAGHIRQFAAGDVQFNH